MEMAKLGGSRGNPLMYCPTYNYIIKIQKSAALFIIIKRPDQLYGEQRLPPCCPASAFLLTATLIVSVGLTPGASAASSVDASSFRDLVSIKCGRKEMSEQRKTLYHGWKILSKPRSCSVFIFIGVRSWLFSQSRLD